MKFKQGDKVYYRLDDKRRQATVQNVDPEASRVDILYDGEKFTFQGDWYDEEELIHVLEPGDVFTNLAEEEVRIVRVGENRVIWEKLRKPGNHFVLTPESFRRRFYVKVRG